MILGIPVHCSTKCQINLQYNLPDIWHQNLLGMQGLFSALRNCKYQIKYHNFDILG